MKEISLVANTGARPVQAGPDFSNFVLDAYRDITNVYCRGMGIEPVFPRTYRESTERGHITIKHQRRNSCDYDVDVTPAVPGSAIRCGADTVPCPVCKLDSGLCAEHLGLCDKCGLEMCVDCTESTGHPCRGCEQKPLCDRCETRPATHEGTEVVNQEMGFKQYGTIRLCDHCDPGERDDSDRMYDEWRDRQDERRAESFDCPAAPLEVEP